MLEYSPIFALEPNAPNGLKMFTDKNLGKVIHKPPDEEQQKRFSIQTVAASMNI